MEKLGKIGNLTEARLPCSSGIFIIKLDEIFKIMITKNKIIKIIELAKKCNECALHHFKKFDKKSVNYKDDNSPLTKADVEVNNIAVYGLQKLFPNIEIISEEFIIQNIF